MGSRFRKNSVYCVMGIYLLPDIPQSIMETCLLFSGLFCQCRKSVDSNKNQTSLSVRKPPYNPKYLWIRLALFEKQLAKILEYLVTNSRSVSGCVILCTRAVELFRLLWECVPLRMLLLHMW